MHIPQGGPKNSGLLSSAVTALIVKVQRKQKHHREENLLKNSKAINSFVTPKCVSRQKQKNKSL